MMDYISPIIGHTGFGCEDNSWDIMCPESFAGVRFDLRSLLQGQMWSLLPIMAYISLTITCGGLDVKTTYRKSCTPNILVISDLTFNPSFKVEHGP